MRVSSQPLPRLDVEPAADRAAPSGGTPFRSALRAAGRADKPVRHSHEPPAPPPPPPPPPETPPRAAADASDARRPLVFAGSDDGEVQPLGPMMRAPALPAARAQARMADGEDAPAGALGDAQLLSAIANASLGSAATAASGLPSVEDSPVATWVAAAVARAVGSLGNAARSAAGAANASPADADAAASASPAPGATEGLDLTGLGSFAMTPLEQAVHELIANANDNAIAHPRAPRAATESTASELDGALLHATTSSTPALPARDAARAAAPATAIPVAAPPEPPANPSHVHLVLDDGPERTVVTVAMRGSEVHVAMRSTDDATAAALARNAASLDHAMRARGLALGELTAEREPRDQRPPRERKPRDTRNPAPTERFKIEETP